MEQAFTLLYLVPGITDVGLEAMPRRERMFLLDRLHEQKVKELKAMKD